MKFSQGTIVRWSDKKVISGPRMFPTLVETLRLGMVVSSTHNEEYVYVLELGMNATMHKVRFFILEIYDDVKSK